MAVGVGIVALMDRPRERRTDGPRRSHDQGRRGLPARRRADRWRHDEGRRVQGGSRALRPARELDARGYYARAQGAGGSRSRPRRRETTAEDAVNDARAALQRAIDNVDREVEAAKERADEAKAEYDSLKASAAARKAEISKRLEALK